MRSVVLRLAAPALVALSMIGDGLARDQDALVEVNGVIQAMPAMGLLGDWTIAGVAVRTDASTVFKQELGKAMVGALVEVKGTREPNSAVLAQRLEVMQGSNAQPAVDAGEFTGAVEALPATGLVGTWRVAGRTVVVIAATSVDQERGGVAAGTVVEVHGTVGRDGSVAAAVIEVRSGGAPVPVIDAGQTEIEGLLDALPPSGLIGTWTVAGRAIVVNAATALDAERGPFAPGAVVQVDATKGIDGSLVARRIERKAGIGASVPPGRFWGRIVALPSGGLQGLWLVDDKIVDVGVATAIRVNDGPLVAGAIVEVSGWIQPDGVVAAKEIETRSAIGQLPGQGDVAVEFRNDQLGHFFVTAATAEIAALDAGMFGGAWRRTGESFKVGGTEAVCRFYGMPPRGPDSHFFTADPRECTQVMGDYAAWTFEDHAFSITPATPDGQCPAGLLPVHRFYNAPARGEDMNHRYTTTAAAYAETAALGWVHEGVVMCART